MFEFKRLFQKGASRPREGLTGGDAAVLELLDLQLLKAEARTVDGAAARAGATEREALRLRQAVIARDIAARTGDVIALRRAASAAERATEHAKPAAAAAAQLERARCAMLGAELFGDEGLNAAADVALALAAAGPDVIVAAAATGKRAYIAAGQALDKGQALDALAALTGYDPAFNILRAKANAAAGKLTLGAARTDRAVMTIRAGDLLKADNIVARGVADLAQVMQDTDAAYYPLTWSRAAIARADGLRRLSVLKADSKIAAEAVEALSRTFDMLLKDHSPLDWAGAQFAHGEALWALAEATGVEGAWARACGAFDRAWSVLRNEPALRLRAVNGERRGALAVRIAVVNDDPQELDALEAAFRCDLAAADPHRDAIGWALAQLNLGRTYLARGNFRPLTREDRLRAGMALSEAAEVFTEAHLDAVASAASNAIQVG